MADLLKDGTALLTGAASGSFISSKVPFVCVLVIWLTLAGIGRAAAVAFARDGCTQLVLGDINITGLEETRRSIKEAHHNAVVEIIHLDVTDEASVERFHAEAVSKFGRIDFAVNSVGYGHPATPIHNFPEKDWDLSYRVNQRGVGSVSFDCLIEMLL